MLAGTFLIPPELTVATLRERMLGQGQVFPPALAERIAAIRVGGAVAAFVFWAIMLAVFAGVVTVFLAFLLGHEGTYRQYLAVVAHAHLISATSGILSSASENRRGGRTAPAFARCLRQLPGGRLRAAVPELFGPFRPVGVAAGGPGSRQDRP